jgi:ribonuclease P protein component
VVRKAREGFPKEYRISRSSDYETIYSSGRKMHSGSFVLFGLANDIEHHRLGVTVSRRIGNAVVRNRVKRRFREIFRRSCDNIPHHFDFVVNAKRHCATVSFRVLNEEFQTAMRRICG